MSNYKNPNLEDNEKRYSFGPHLKFKKVKSFPRTRSRQQLRSSIPLYQMLTEVGSDPITY